MIEGFTHEQTRAAFKELMHRDHAIADLPQDVQMRLVIEHLKQREAEKAATAAN